MTCPELTKAFSFLPRKILLSRKKGILFHHPHAYVVMKFIDERVG
jgi:hypothetical protein